MKRLNLFFGIFSLFHAFQLYSNSTSHPSSATITRSLITEHFQTSSTNKELNKHGTKTFDKAGDYYLSNSINFYPSGTHTEIIHITSSNVTLNLNGKELYMSANNDIHNVKGIVVDPNLSNIVITNGSIHDCSGAGIIVGANCSNISLTKLSITNCGLAGIVVGYNPFDTGTYSSVYEGQELVKFVDPVSGQENLSENILLDDIFISRTLGTHNDGSTDQFSHAIGIQITDVSNFQIKNLISNGNKYSASIKDSSTNPGGYYAAGRGGYNGVGIELIRSENGHIENSEASYNSGYSAFGFKLNSCKNINFSKCHANHNSDDADPTSTFSQAITFEFSNHRDLGRAAGFILNDSSENSFDHCTASHTSGTREAAGFWLRRHSIISSTSSSAKNSQLFDPTILQAEVDYNQTATNVDYGAMLLIPTIPATPPTLNPMTSGYNVVSASSPALYLVHGGSNGNRLTNCTASRNSSKLLSAHGFISQGNNNNHFEKIEAEENICGSGTTSYISAGSISDFDTSTGIWSITEYDKYKNQHTDKIVQYGSGISLESIILPLSDWDSGNNRLKLKTDVMTNPIFLGVKVATDPTYPTYVIPVWAESSTYVMESKLAKNHGGSVGAGVGALLNGTHKNIIQKNKLFSNHSLTTGTTSTVTCGTSEIGIGALGGYGILDLASNTTALILENLAYGNQVVRPNIILSCTPTVTGIGAFIEGANYHAKYSDSTLSIPKETALAGDFSPFNMFTPYSNIDWGNSQTPCSSYEIKEKIKVESVPRVFKVQV